MNAIKTKGCGYKYERDAGTKRVTKTCLEMKELKGIILSADKGAMDPTAPVNTTETKNYANYLNIPETFAGAQASISTEKVECTGGSVKHTESTCSFGSCAASYNAYYKNTPDLAVGANYDEFKAGNTKLQTGNSTVQHLDFTNSSSEFWPGYLEPMVDTTFAAVSPVQVSGIESALDGIAVAIRSLNAWKTQVNSALKNRGGGGGGKIKVDGHGLVWADKAGGLHALRPHTGVKIVHMSSESDTPLFYGPDDGSVLGWSDTLHHTIGIPYRTGFLVGDSDGYASFTTLHNLYYAADNIYTASQSGVLVAKDGQWEVKCDHGILVHTDDTNNPIAFVKIPEGNIPVGTSDGSLTTLSGTGLVQVVGGSASVVTVPSGDSDSLLRVKNGTISTLPAGTNMTGVVQTVNGEFNVFTTGSVGPLLINANTGLYVSTVNSKALGAYPMLLWDPNALDFGVNALSGDTGILIKDHSGAPPFISVVPFGEGYLKGTTTSVTWVEPVQCDTK